jgi:hypothetical protein
MYFSGDVIECGDRREVGEIHCGIAVWLALSTEKRSPTGMNILQNNNIRSRSSPELSINTFLLCSDNIRSHSNMLLALVLNPTK